MTHQLAQPQHDQNLGRVPMAESSDRCPPHPQRAHHQADRFDGKGDRRSMTTIWG